MNAGPGQGLALSTYLGHSSIQITLDRYGHLMPGNEDEAVALVDAYLERATVRDSRERFPAVPGGRLNWQR